MSFLEKDVSGMPNLLTHDAEWTFQLTNDNKMPFKTIILMTAEALLQICEHMLLSSFGSQRIHRRLAEDS